MPSKSRTPAPCPALHACFQRASCSPLSLTESPPVGVSLQALAFLKALTLPSLLPAGRRREPVLVRVLFASALFDRKRLRREGGAQVKIADTAAEGSAGERERPPLQYGGSASNTSVLSDGRTDGISGDVQIHKLYLEDAQSEEPRPRHHDGAWEGASPAGQRSQGQ